MTWINSFKSKRRLPATLAAGLAISTFLVAGIGVGSARADDHGDRDRGQERHESHDNRWNDGHYRAPPVVYEREYAAPTYYAPPLVYGPGVGISLPGINFNFR